LSLFWKEYEILCIHVFICNNIILLLCSIKIVADRVTVFYDLSLTDVACL